MSGLSILGAALAAPAVEADQAVETLIQRVTALDSVADARPVGLAAAKPDHPSEPRVRLDLGVATFLLSPGQTAVAAQRLRALGRTGGRADLIGLSAHLSMAVNDAHRACERQRAFAMRGAH